MRHLAVCALLLLSCACTRLAQYGDPRLRPADPSAAPGQSAAAPGPAAEVVVRGKGTIRLLEEAEGTSWGLRADDGKRYRLSSLPPVYRKDGTRIRFSGRVLPGGGPGLWGTELELTEVSGV
jgi:hypothetical protein